ncbi:MAG: MFS transporter [Burkholderiaceae bacterium]|jgi:DHA1 family tetracycline resistance protein-like MFS transporter
MASTLPLTSPAPLRHPYWILAAVCLLGLMSTVGVSMPYPILAPIFVGGPVDAFTHFGGLEPSVLMGIALAANPLGILIGSLYTGPLSDRHGRRLVLAVTLVATVVGHLLTAAALVVRNYPLFVLARFATGLVESNTAVGRALLADMHEQIDRTRAFAFFNACLYGGWLLGPLVGGLTLPLGESVPFVLAAAMTLPCVAILFIGLPATPAKPAGDAPPNRNVLALLRADRTLGLIFGLQLAYTLALNTLYEFSPLWMFQNAGFGSRGIAFVTAGQCAVMTLTSVLAGRFGGTGAHPLRRAANYGLVAAGCLALMAVLPGHLGIFVIMAMGFPTAMYNAVMPAWMSERFAEHGQGRVMGLLSTIFCVANVIVALAGGWIALLSTRWIMALGGVAGVVSAVLMLRLARTEDASR